MTDNAMAYISTMSQLQQLDISGLNNIGPAGLVLVGNIRDLESLSMHGIDTVDDRVMEAVAHLRKLKHLDISSCVSVTEDGIESIGSLINMVSLNLSSNSRIGQQQAWRHLLSLRNLEVFKIKSVLFSEEQMTDFCEALPKWSKLTELRLGYCQIRDEHAPAFSKLPDLRVLSIHNSSALRAESYSYFSKVMDLDLSRSTIPVHALDNLQQLVRLEFKNSKFVTITETRTSPNVPPQSPSMRKAGRRALAGSAGIPPSPQTPNSYSPRDRQALTSSTLTAYHSALEDDDDEDFASPFSSSPSSSSSSLSAHYGSPETPSNFELSTSPALFTKLRSRKRHLTSSPPSPDSPLSFSSVLPRDSAPISPPSGRKMKKSRNSTPDLPVTQLILNPSHSPSSSTLSPSPSNSSSLSQVRSSPQPITSRSNYRSLSQSLETSPPSLHTPTYNGFSVSPAGSSYLSQPVTSQQMLELRPLDALRQLPNLRQLSLRVENVTDADLVQIAKCRRLRELDLLWLSNVTSRGLQKLRHLRMLQQLNLTNCKNLTDEALQVILPNLKFLRALSLAHCTLVGDDGLLAIASNSLQLRYLVLFQLQLVTSEGITSLVTLNELEVLEVSGCHQIDVAYCKALLKEFLPGLHVNHNAFSRQSAPPSSHCTIS